MEFTVLNNGVKMPMEGFGVFQVPDPKQCEQAVLGAYTNCNHGEGLAVIHPVLYRHMLPEAEKQFARLAVNVWGISADGKSEKQLAEEFINALADFIKEVGLPTSFSEMGIANADLKAIADSTVMTGGCCKKFTREELLEVLNECS